MTKKRKQSIFLTVTSNSHNLHVTLGKLCDFSLERLTLLKAVVLKV